MEIVWCKRMTDTGGKYCFRLQKHISKFFHVLSIGGFYVCLTKKPNQVTHLFFFSIPCCKNVVKDINTEANYFIAVNVDSGHWYVVE